MLLEAEASEDRFFDIGVWDWANHDMQHKELHSSLSPERLFHLDLMEQGGLVKKSTCEHSDVQMWEITWKGYDFLESVRSDTIWGKLKSEAEAKGVSLTIEAAILAGRTAAAFALSSFSANF